MKIEKINNELVVRIPLEVERINPYNEMVGDNSPQGMMDNIVGVIEGHHNDGNDWDDYGFMYLQDMSYKGKGDQLTDWAVKYHEGKEEFEKLCKELGISIWYI